MTKDDANKLKEDRLKRNLELSENGVSFDDIETAYIGEGIEIGAGTHIAPCVSIRGNTVIGKDCFIGQGCVILDSRIGDESRIEQGSRIEDTVIGCMTIVLMSVLLDCIVGDRTKVGPFAYIRPDTVVGSSVRIGDFVELKNSEIGDGTKVSHLTYVGDAKLGDNINLGCGVVFVNYDGKDKHVSKVEDGAFIGCNVNIISPVTIGESAYIAAGTTVTGDVPAGSLSVGRAKAKNLQGWVKARGLLNEKK